MLSLTVAVVLNAEFEAMRKYMGDTACRIDCTFDRRRAGSTPAPGLRPHPQEAEDGVRCAAACTSC